jgi:hypothetical protein
MAKNAKVTNSFGVDPESFNTQNNTTVTTQTKEPVREPVGREKKDRRIQILTFGSLVDRLDAYAKRRGVSRAEVFEMAVEHFLKHVEEQ